MKVLISERLSPHKYKTPEGYLICVDAVLARTGKQTYRRSEIFDTDDDSEIDVDRKPEEVFSQSTLASFENKPVTVEHPDEDVNSGNFKDYAVGFVRDVKKGTVDGQDVILGTLVIQDAQTIEEIENGEHTDLSCGYDCDIDDSDSPEQKNIRGNHVALCQCGRAGNARIVDSQKVNDVKYFAVSKYDSGKYNNINSALSDLINFGEDDEVKLYSLKNEKDIQNLYSDDLIGIYKNGKLIEKGPAFTKRFNADSVKDAYYTIGGYTGKYDPVAMTDIKRAAKYGVNGSIERTSDGWQLVLRGTPANLRNVIENYFALDPSGIEDSVKDEDVFVVNVKNAEDRDVSKFITEAQNVGFTTDDKGYSIHLKNGNKEMLAKLKSKFYTSAIKFEDAEDKKFIVVNKKGKEIYQFKTREEAEQMVSSLTKAGEYGYSVKDTMKKDDLNIRPTSKAGSDKAIYVLQSDLDKNLFFYIGKTFAMKDGSYTYQKFEMNGVSPEALRADLLKHGWHDTNENHNMLIDEESTYEEVTKKLEEGADKLQKKMSDSYLSAPAIMRFIRNAESFKEMKTLQFGDEHMGYYVQIQNPGKEEYTLYNGKFKSKGLESKSWGRVWYDGKFLKAFEGPYNVVRQELIAFLSSQRIQDSMKLIKIAKIAKTIKK